jgi:hypothetical protein
MTSARKSTDRAIKSAASKDLAEKRPFLEPIIRDVAAKIGDAGDRLTDAVMAAIAEHATGRERRRVADDTEELRGIVFSAIDAELIEMLVEKIIADQDGHLLQKKHP